jgi:L-malate glycosyltransferase
VSQFKNVNSLIRAFALVRRSFGDWRLRLVGAGYEPYGTAELWARARGLAEGITFHGKASQTELIALYRSADLLVHPSREEAFGNVLVEAMSQGLPIIGGRNSGAVPWVLDFGTAGRLVDVSSPVSIANAICEVLTDEAEWWRLSRGGYRRSQSEFRSSVCARRYGASYAALA